MRFGLFLANQKIAGSLRRSCPALTGADPALAAGELRPCALPADPVRAAGELRLVRVCNLCFYKAWITKTSRTR